jgi:PAS domain S-box-containing protein
MLERISLLSPHTVVMFQMAPQFSDQPDFGTWDLLGEVAQRFPTYSVWPRFCVNGCVGGVFKDPVQEWKMTGDLAIRVLSGERPDDIPIVHNSDLRPIVDWRALQRWHIPESALPSGSIVRFREPTLWERYRGYILAGIALLFAQALLILALLWQRVRKRKAEAVLRESEKRFKVMADTTPAQIWMCDEHGDITYLNERRLAFTGLGQEPGYGDSWTTYIHPDDLPDVMNSFSNALKNHRPFSMEYRLRRSDGIYRWMFDVASPRVNGDGSFAGFIGSAIDVTDQKMAQQALERVGGQLIEAQEKERARIGRELHDDICQRLAILSFELERANEARDGSPATASLEDIQKHCEELAADVQSLSHQLHSSPLDVLGLVAAISGLRNEFARNHDVSVAFTHRDVPRNLPNNISLCIFRVTQEALHNALKYSGASEFKVDLSIVGDNLQLVVEDEGAGFDVQEARQKGGLGLISMHERINLINGKFNIESAPGMGTRITAIVPGVFDDAYAALHSSY